MSDNNSAVEGRPAVASTPVSEDYTENAGHEITAAQCTQDGRDELASRNIGDAEAALRAIRSASHHIIDLFLPVTLCMVIVVATINTVPSISKPRASNITALMFGTEASGKSDTGTVLWHALVVVLIILGVVIVMSIALIILYKYRFYKILRGFLFLSSVVLLFFFCFIYLLDVLTNYNTAMDFMTLAMVIWNYGVVGIIAIHFSGPILLQQAYLIVNSALLAITFIKFLPDWSVWLLLAIMSIWDLIAVLCPMGPLRILVETAQQREEPLFPSLVYSTRMIWFYGVSEEEETSAGGSQNPKPDEADETSKQLASFSPTPIPSPGLKEPEGWKSSVIEGHPSENGGSDGNSRDLIGQLNSPTAPLEDENIEGTGDSMNAENGDVGQAEVSGSKEKRTKRSPTRIMEQLARREDSGVKLGLGDFIFYSILVGKASATSDWTTTMACFIAILVGLSTTLLLLFIFRKALPALPISVAFGLIFYFVTSQVVVEFVDMCQLRQIYI